MRKFGHEQGHPPKSVEIDCFLVVGRGPYPQRRPSVRITADHPNLARNERALNLRVSLPVALFETPTISATIAVEAPTEGVKIDIGAVAEAVRGIVGMDVDVQVVEPGQ